MANASNNTVKSPLATIDAKIASIRSRGVILRRDSHDCLILVMDHYIEHGDFTRLEMLTKAVSESLGSSLAQAMNQWVATFIPSLEWATNDRKFVHKKGVTMLIKDVENLKIKSSDVTAPEGGSITVKDGSRYFTGNGRDLHFYELERIAKQEPFDFMKVLMLAVKRAEREREASIKAGEQPTVSLAAINAVKSMAEHVKDYKDEPSVSAKEDQDHAKHEDSTNVEEEGLTEDPKEAEELDEKVQEAA